MLHMKKLLIASILSLGFVFTAPGPSEAAPDVKIYLGIPHYGYQVGPDYEYRRGYGWYRSKNARRVSCDRARSLVRNRGYNNVQVVECQGATYTFRAVRNGKRYKLFVNSRSGGVWRG
jgi:hypothetical protein